MDSGFAVMSEQQYLPGYCLLMAFPTVAQLNDLSPEGQAQFLRDMAEIGGAVQAVTGCLRVNYAIYGNVDPFLHAHIWPRYEWEEEELRTAPPLTFPVKFRKDPSRAYCPDEHDSLKARILEHLRRSCQNS